MIPHHSEWLVSTIDCKFVRFPDEFLVAHAVEKRKIQKIENITAQAIVIVLPVEKNRHIAARIPLNHVLRN